MKYQDKLIQLQEKKNSVKEEKQKIKEKMEALEEKREEIVKKRDRQASLVQERKEIIEVLENFQILANKYKGHIILSLLKNLFSGVLCGILVMIMYLGLENILVGFSLHSFWTGLGVFVGGSLSVILGLSLKDKDLARNIGDLRYINGIHDGFSLDGVRNDLKKDLNKSEELEKMILEIDDELVSLGADENIRETIIRELAVMILRVTEEMERAFSDKTVVASLDKHFDDNPIIRSLGLK